jgi:hypothetical protein
LLEGFPSVVCKMFIKFVLHTGKPRDMKERALDKLEERTGEDRNERTARELIELLNELRVILPGVQVLFAFLLTVPFPSVSLSWTTWRPGSSS